MNLFCFVLELAFNIISFPRLVLGERLIRCTTPPFPFTLRIAGWALFPVSRFLNVDNEVGDGDVLHGKRVLNWECSLLFSVLVKSDVSPYLCRGFFF